MKNKSLGLVIQFVLSFCTVIFFFVSLFESSFLVVVKSLIGLTLFSMAYNNATMYKRKYFTFVYIVFAVIVIASIFVDGM